jgi:hypothetical protein
MAARRTPEDLIGMIESFLNETDEWAWDDFESVPIADPLLEAIRQRAIPMGPPDADIPGLNALLAELRTRYPAVQ